MMTIILFGCLGVLLQEAEPIIMIKRYIGFKQESYDDQTKIMKFIHRMIYCAMCLTFWVTLITTLDPTTAIISSVLSAILHKIILN